MHKLLTTKEAAKVLGIAPSTLTYRVRKGLVKTAFSCGRMFLFDKEQIEKLAEESPK